MDPKEYMNKIAELPVEEITIRMTDTFSKLYEAPEAERVNQMNALMMALSEHSEETHAKIIQARFEAFTKVSPEVKSAILSAGGQSMASQPESYQEREQRLMKQIAPNLSEPAKGIMQELLDQMQK